MEEEDGVICVAKRREGEIVVYAIYTKALAPKTETK